MAYSDTDEDSSGDEDDAGDVQQEDEEAFLEQ